MVDPVFVAESDSVEDLSVAVLYEFRATDEGFRLDGSEEIVSIAEVHDEEEIVRRFDSLAESDDVRVDADDGVECRLAALVESTAGSRIGLDLAFDGVELGAFLGGEKIERLVNCTVAAAA